MSVLNLFKSCEGFYAESSRKVINPLDHIESVSKFPTFVNSEIYMAVKDISMKDIQCYTVNC